jgi:hypothetical protein
MARTANQRDVELFVVTGAVMNVLRALVRRRGHLRRDARCDWPGRLGYLRPRARRRPPNGRALLTLF